MTITTKDFDYHLPEELIAQTPLEDRATSKMLVVNRETDQLKDAEFTQILDYLKPGDALVVNETRVIPARIFGVKPDTGGHLEVLLLTNTQGNQWECLVKKAKRAKVVTKIEFGEDARLKAEVIEELDHGGRIIEFFYEGVFLEVLDLRLLRRPDYTLPPSCSKR